MQQMPNIRTQSASAELDMSERSCSLLAMQHWALDLAWPALNELEVDASDHHKVMRSVRQPLCMSGISLRTMQHDGLQGYQ